MSKSNLVTEVECLQGQIGGLLCGEAVEEDEMIRRLEIPFSLPCHALSGLYLHLRYYHALYRLTHLHT